MQEQLQKRLLIVKKQLKQLAGQMKQYMVLWDYQEKGFTMYRLVTIGENCEDCTSRHGLVFPISEAECGVNLAPFHPNCDCKAEILDDRGKAFIAISPEPKEEKNTTETESGLDYLKTSLRQVMLGNYADDTNLGGTLGQITLGLLGLDLPADIRDLLYDVTNWQSSPEHILQTILDTAALLPIVGGIKYADETADALKAVKKHGDEVAKVTKIITKNDLSTIIKNGKISVDDIKVNPYVFKEKSAEEISKALENAGYNVTISYSAKSKSGAQIIKINNPGDGRNITQIQVSPGGGRHGNNPYIKISTTDQGTIKIVNGPKSLYKTDGKEKATIIFQGGN